LEEESYTRSQSLYFILMGCSGSRIDPSEGINHLQKVKPEYYVKDVVLADEDIELAKESWMIVMSGDNTKPFLTRLEADPNEFRYSSTLTWFYDAFYEKFFEVCPDAEPMFHKVSMLKQGRLIAAVISSSLDSLKNPAHLEEKLIKNTKRHNGKGIKSEWYSKMGDALIQTLELVIGSELFTAATKNAWERIYSYLLSIILPVSVEHEISEMRVSRSQKNSSLVSVSGRVIEHFSSHMSSKTGVFAAISSQFADISSRYHISSKNSSKENTTRSKNRSRRLTLKSARKPVSRRVVQQASPHLHPSPHPSPHLNPHPHPSSSPHPSPHPSPHRMESSVKIQIETISPLLSPLNVKWTTRGSFVLGAILGVTSSQETSQISPLSDGNGTLDRNLTERSKSRKIKRKICSERNAVNREFHLEVT